MRIALLCCVTAALLLFSGPVGCGATPNDPTSEFNRQHPEYDPDYNTPSYFHPADSDN